MADDRIPVSEIISAGQGESSDSLASGSAHPSPGGFGQLAKRITSITSNCLFTAIVLVAGLGIGRQILIWWAADAPRQSAGSQNSGVTAGLGDSEQLHVMQFGGQGWSMARREYRGTREGVQKRLCRDCRDLIEKVSRLGEKPTPQQKTLLDSLAKSTPIDAELPRWQLFAPDRNIPLLVGVSPAIMPIRETGEKTIDVSSVILWGTALQSGEDAWSILIFSPSADGCNALRDFPDIPLPPKCRKILSIQAVSGGAMVSFSGPGDPENWQAHFHRWFAKGDWKTIFPWQKTGSAWYAQYSGKVAGKTYDVNLHVYPDGRGGMTGLVVLGTSD